MSREDRKNRVSLARRRAEEHSSGFTTTTIKMPEGLRFFDQFKPGVVEIDIVPYIVVKGKGQPGGNPIPEKGDLYYERTYWAYRQVGPEEKWHICPSKTFGKKDYIQEVRQKMAKDPNSDPNAIKALEPKERQLFLVYQPSRPDLGLQLLDISYHKFGKLLDTRIKNSKESLGWDLFYFPDSDGLTLSVTIVDGGKYGTEAKAIDFLRRETPLPDKIVNHGFDLDSMLVDESYEELKAAFLGISKEEASRDSEVVAAPVRKSEQQPATEQPKPTGQSVVKGNDGRDYTIGHAEPAEKRVESPKPMTADQKGLKDRDAVSYKGKRYEIFRISGDGTSLALADANDDIIKGIGVEEVERWVEAEKEEAPFESKPAPATSPVASAPSGGDDDWDAEWDKN